MVRVKAIFLHYTLCLDFCLRRDARLQLSAKSLGRVKLYLNTWKVYGQMALSTEIYVALVKEEIIEIKVQGVILIDAK